MPTIFVSPPAESLPSTPPPESEGKPAGAQLMPFTAFAKRPKNVRFETQEREETVELFLRQHPIVNVPWAIITVFLLLAPTVIFPMILRSPYLPLTVPWQYLIVGTVFWYVASFGFILTNFLHWFFNIYIVTNERIVDIDFLYLLYKHFAVAELSKIQDISYVTGGILGTIFNYGNVYIQTASEIPTISFEKVPQPHKVVEMIRDLTERQHDKHGS